MKTSNLQIICICLIISSRIALAQEHIQDWKYHKEIWINHHTNAEELDNYQVSFEINTQKLIETNKLSPTGHDLRIYDPESHTFLCYWLENEVFEQKTKIWFRIPKLLPNTKKRVLLCYGNPQAKVINYENCTFQFFDDFTGNTLNYEKWEPMGNGNYKIQNSQIIFEGDGADIIIRSTQRFEMPLITEMKVTDSQGKYLALALIKSDKTPYIWEGYTMALNQDKQHMELALTQSELSSCGAYTIYPTGIKGKLSEENTGIWSLSWITRNTIFASWPGGDLLEPNSVWVIQDLDIILGVLACDMGETFSGNLSVDWIRVRKLAVNPPQLILGTENISPKIGVIKYLKDGIG